MNWVKSLPSSDNKPVVIISVSGGGEVTPNLACRLPLKKIFTKKKYNIVYEEMIVMPSNWIVPTKPVLVYKLLEVLPIKISKIVNDVINQKIRLTNPPLGNRILTFLGQLEHVGAHYFGKKIKVLPSCNSCGLCEKGCPVSTNHRN
jgi:ferredoxin